MAEATKKDSKQEEVQALSEESTEKTEPGIEEATSQKTYTEEEFKKILKERDDFKQAFFKEKNRTARVEEFKTETKKPQDDYESEGEDDYETDPKKIIRKELAKLEVQRAEQSFKNALDKFIRTHSEYSPENDYNDANWKQIKSYIEELKNGAFKGDESGYLERMEMIHNGITKPNKSEKSESETEKVEDSGVGNITSQPKAKKDQPSAMTRPLNDFERNAAQGFPGKTQKEKEDGYRKKLAELESRRGKK